MVELLGPAGSIEMGKAAIKAGADSIFCGLRPYSRRKENELPLSKVLELTDYVKGKGKKIYIAVNSEIPEKEIKNVINYRVKPLVNAGADGFILRTPQLMKEISQYDTKVIASVGCNIKTKKEIDKFKSYGVNMAVLSSEFSRKPIDYDSIKMLSKEIKLEMLVTLTACIGGFGGCTYFESINHKLPVAFYIDPEDSLVHEYTEFNPNLGGGCLRMCNNIDDPLVQKIMGIETEKLKELKAGGKGNISIMLSDEVPRLIESGVSIIKIQGRECPTKWVAETVSMYRDIIDRSIVDNEKIKSLKSEWDDIREKGDLVLLKKLYELMGYCYSTRKLDIDP